MESNLLSVDLYQIDFYFDIITKYSDSYRNVRFYLNDRKLMKLGACAVCVK